MTCLLYTSNTDGVVYIADKSARFAIADAIKEVEQLTQLTFESDDYESFYQYDVNNYFGVRKGYSQSGDPRLIEKLSLIHISGGFVGNVDDTICIDLYNLTIQF